MRILYFYQYFSTPKGSWGTRVYDFASEWVKQGHEVTVVSSIYSKSDLKAKKFVETQFHNGIKVIVLNIRIDNKHNKLNRILSFLKYATLSSWYALTIPCDVVISSSGPITVGLPGLISKIFRKKLFVFEVRDLWPLGAIELGYLNNKLIIWLSYLFEKICYKSSDLIVVLSPGMKKYIQKVTYQKNIISVTNAADIKLFSKNHKLTTKLKKFKNISYAIYYGNIGEVNNSYWLYKTAKYLQKLGRMDIKILMIGDGPLKEKLQIKANKKNLSTLIFMDLLPKKNIIPLIQNSFVSIVPLKDLKFLETSSPNKFFESLAAGVPVIQNTKGWMYEFLKKYNVGYSISSKKPQILAKKLIEMRESQTINPEKIKNLARKYFDKKKLAEKMLENIRLIK